MKKNVRNTPKTCLQVVITKWLHLKGNCFRVSVNYVDTYIMGKAKSLVKPKLELSEIIRRQPWKTSNVDDFALIYLNRNWYILVQDYINERFD